MADDEIAEIAIDELEKIGFIRKSDALDHTVIRVPKTYPAYFGTYPEFDKLKSYINLRIFTWLEETACTGITTRITQCLLPWLLWRILKM